MRKKGFTLIELLAVIIILAAIALIATPIILGIIEDSKKNAFKASAYGISGAAKNAFVEIMYAGSEPEDITYQYTNGTLTSNPAGHTLNYNGDKPQNGQVVLTKDGKVSLILHDGKWCATKSVNTAEITILELSLEDCMPKLVDESGANAPVLATGMTAVRWDGANWVNATNIDNVYKQNWYDYGEKKWANAKTADGSMWVWIPRYVYKITSGWHSTTAGSISIQFSKDTDDNWNSGIIGPLDTRTIAAASDASTNGNKYTNHPAFWWDNNSNGVRDSGEELKGFWVAKFEASPPSGSTCYTSITYTNCDVTNLLPRSLPNTTAWKKIKASNMFIVSRNMETSSIYGWPTASGLNSDGTFTNDTNNIDTHLIKSTEWGAVAYLTKSTFGINADMGYQAYTVLTTGTNYQTTLNYGTTGNIYGIFDMSGHYKEMVAAHLNENSTNLNNNGAVLKNAAAKYKTVYAFGSTRAAAYALMVNNKGDALYETSSEGDNPRAWYGKPSYSTYSGMPFIVRGEYTTMSSIFAYRDDSGTSNGGSSDLLGFRPTIIVQ